MQWWEDKVQRISSIEILSYRVRRRECLDLQQSFADLQLTRFFQSRFLSCDVCGRLCGFASRHKKPAKFAKSITFEDTYYELISCFKNFSTHKYIQPQRLVHSRKYTVKFPCGSIKQLLLRALVNITLYLNRGIPPTRSSFSCLAACFEIQFFNIKTLHYPRG